MQPLHDVPWGGEEVAPVAFYEHNDGMATATADDGGFDFIRGFNVIRPYIILTCAHVVAKMASDAVALAPSWLIADEVKHGLQVDLARLERRIELMFERRMKALEDKLTLRARQSARSARSQFFLGLVLGMPISLFCAYLAFLIGWA